jgi:hypothetical protein
LFFQTTVGNHRWFLIYILSKQFGIFTWKCVNINLYLIYLIITGQLYPLTDLKIHIFDILN